MYPVNKNQKFGRLYRLYRCILCQPQRLYSNDTYILLWSRQSGTYFNSNPDHLRKKRL